MLRDCGLKVRDAGCFFTARQRDRQIAEFGAARRALRTIFDTIKRPPECPRGTQRVEHITIAHLLALREAHEVPLGARITTQALLTLGGERVATGETQPQGPMVADAARLAVHLARKIRMRTAELDTLALERFGIDIPTHQADVTGVDRGVWRSFGRARLAPLPRVRWHRHTSGGVPGVATVIRPRLAGISDGAVLDIRRAPRAMCEHARRQPPSTDRARVVRDEGAHPFARAGRRCGLPRGSPGGSRSARHGAIPTRRARRRCRLLLRHAGVLACNRAEPRIRTAAGQRNGNPKTPHTNNANITTLNVVARRFGAPARPTRSVSDLG